MNWVDGGAFLYKWSGAETFIKVLDFIEKWYEKRNILIHCDKGLSRSPTLGLIYLAKRLKSISDDSFEDAKQEFIKMYPDYQPGGIADYVEQNWNFIN